MALSLSDVGRVRPWNEAHSWIPRCGEAKSPCHPLPPLAEEGPDLGHCHLMSLMSLLVHLPDPSAPAPSFFLENFPVSCFPELSTCTASSPISPDYKSRNTSENAPGLPRYSRQPAIPLSWHQSPPCWSSPPPWPGSLHISLVSQAPDLWFGLFVSAFHIHFYLHRPPLSLYSCCFLCLEYPLLLPPHPHPMHAFLAG